MIKYRQWTMFVEVLYSLPQQPRRCPQLVGRAVYWSSVRCIARCHLQTTAAGLWLLKASSTLYAWAAEWVRGVRRDAIPGWDSCTKNVPCCRCSCTAKLFVRVLVECGVSCWEDNASRTDYSDAILLAKVFRYCAAAHHNSLIRRWSFRFHCR